MGEGGGVGGLNRPVGFFACQYMKIPADFHPGHPPPPKNS